MRRESQLVIAAIVGLGCAQPNTYNPGLQEGGAGGTLGDTGIADHAASEADTAQPDAAGGTPADTLGPSLGGSDAANSEIGRASCRERV